MTEFESELTQFYSLGTPSRLEKSVVYSLTAGGKRIRPRLFFAMLKGFELEMTDAALKVAAALEMIHTGSLIHDDLPAMDDDVLRRAKATNHVAFDEATAILAGDALFLDPYAVICESELSDEQIVALVREFSFASGSRGMVAGQMLDMTSEGKTLTLPEIEHIHTLKTGQLLTLPFLAAGIFAGSFEKEMAELREIGRLVGLAFQIRDDIFDVTETVETLGKTPGKDSRAEKSTYVSVLGLEKAKVKFEEALSDARAALSALPEFDTTEIFEILESLTL
ncbi:MAG: polyprenyl synthetase family protein [Streptococcaceae bacterium]|jgi:geranylgeranyl diphosphate synthase type II|nr:polyprenyl synthetase family protein [Streptococcaceae bacterium]